MRAVNAARWIAPAWVAVTALLLGVCPAAAQFDNFQNTVLYGAANGTMRPCRAALPNGNFDLTGRSGPSTLYTIDPANGYATTIGPIQDPNLAGRVILRGLDPKFVGVPDRPYNTEIECTVFEDEDYDLDPSNNADNPINLSDRACIALDSDERLVDVCGLAGIGDGRLMGTATLEKTGMHVLVEIDPATAVANVIGTLLIDGGDFEREWLTGTRLPDPTLCHPEDISFDATQGALYATTTCRWFFETRTPPDPLFYKMATIDMATGETTSDLLTPNDIAPDFIPLTVNNFAFNATSASVAIQPSTGIMHNSFDNKLIYYRSPHAGSGASQLGEVNMELQYTEAELELVEAYLETQPNTDQLTWADYWSFFPASPPIDRRTVSMDFDPDQNLYRALIQPVTNRSQIEMLDYATGLPIEGPFYIVDAASPTTDIDGIQAIAFVSYPDSEDQTGSGNVDELVDCPLTPLVRQSNACNVDTVSKRGIFTYYKKSTGMLYFRADLGFGLSKQVFGQPDQVTNYALCLYSENGDDEGRLTLFSGRQMPAGDSWREYSTSFKYTDSPPFTRSRLRLMSDGSAKIQFYGLEFPFPDLPISDAGVTIEVLGSNGQCWSGDFPSSTFIRNDDLKFRAKRKP